MVFIDGLDLFSGIGGLTLALSEWVRPIAYCERDPYAQGVLLSRMESGEIPDAPIWDDIKTLHGNMLPPVDIIYGGFPCQDISSAGLRKGLEGKRSGLFFEITRLVDEIRPRFIFLENVSAITVRGLDTVLGEITARGYDCRWLLLSASDVGAPHIRERWWLLAHAHSKTERVQQISKQQKQTPKHMGTSPCRKIARAPEGLFKPRVDRAGDGIPFKVDRYRGLGNSVVPQCAKKAFETLCGLDGAN